MTSKFEQLIEFVINDEEQKAKELFHDIVVEKSREIYETLMDEAEEELEEKSVRVHRPKTCVECGETKYAMKKCAGCFENDGTETFYCDKKCQIKHWRNGHRKECHGCKSSGGKKSKRNKNKQSKRKKTRRPKLIT